MAIKHFDIVVPGHYYCDVIFTGLPSFPALGTEIFTDDLMVVPGGVMNTVVGLSRLGVQVGWLGSLGTDFFSRFIRERISEEGIDATLLKQLDAPLRRVTVAMSYPHDRAFLTYVDKPPSLAALLQDLLDRDDVTLAHLHFPGLALDPDLLPLLRLCRERRIKLSMDSQHQDDDLSNPLVRETLSLLDVFMPNSSEAKHLTNTATIDDAAQVLQQFVKYLVIKDGAYGAQAWDSGHHSQAPAIRVEPVDTTGAGDIFNAGFLSAYMAGHPAPVCLQWGNIAGGISTTGYGGCTKAPTQQILQDWLR
jgi:sugar/nucleoside kinase (ribokinase family)